MTTWNAGVTHRILSVVGRLARIVAAALLVLLGIPIIGVPIGAAGIGASLILSSADYPVSAVQRCFFAAVLLFLCVVGILRIGQWIEQPLTRILSPLFQGDVEGYLAKGLQLLLGLGSLASAVGAAMARSSRSRLEGIGICVLLLVGVVSTERERRRRAGSPPPA